jgi:hypothetical protein
MSHDGHLAPMLIHEARQRTQSDRYVRVHRVWGLFGDDVFDLYFGDDDWLLAFRQEHVN